MERLPSRKIQLSLFTIAGLIVAYGHGRLSYRLCGNSILLLSRGQNERYSCCGQSIFDQTKSFCCGNLTPIPFNETHIRDCCGGRTVYDKASQICCQGRFLSPANSRTRCCGKIAYDTKKYLCENEKLLGYNEDTCHSDRTVIVHLFNWKWTDIAAECERYLGPAGFCGVQISPPNEHVIIKDPLRPWYERYQPISYKLISRSGSEEELRDMVRRCNAVKIRIYVDVVINHMCGKDIGPGRGSAGTFFDSRLFNFSGVPFRPFDFNCCHCHRCGTSSCSIEDYGNAAQVRNCQLLGLLDLDLGKDYVRQKVADFMNVLIDLGVAGFRVDAAKHMWPGDLDDIFSRLSNLPMRHGFPPGTRPFMFMEVIDLGGEPIKSEEYFHLGRVTEFKFCREIGKAFQRHFHLSSLQSISRGWGFAPSQSALVFVDNHDNQRGHGGGGSTILTFHNLIPYTLATIFTLSHPYGFVRIMSSYRWDGGPSENDWIGPPHDSDFSIKTVEVYENGTCSGDWVCEHRWHSIKNMVEFRNVVKYHPLTNWWDNGHHQIAFSRGNRGFVVIINEPNQDLQHSFQTGLPSGMYCDIISGDIVNDTCTGVTVVVGEDGKADIEIPVTQEIPAIAFHVGSKLAQYGEEEEEEEEEAAPPGATVTSPGEQFSGYNRTVILVRFQSTFGQYVFLRGGINHGTRAGCTNDASVSHCAIPIRHVDVGHEDHFIAYNAWRVNDRKLDWYGPETGQGLFEGQQAQGTPTFWTTNNANASAFKEVNRFGDHYWMLEVDMDCSSTEDGWFEFKAFILNGSGWESDVSQDMECVGGKGGSRPFASKNHVALCGHINVFQFADNGCYIDNF